MKEFVKFFLPFFIAGVYCCKPVLIINGMLDSSEHLKFLKANIEKDLKCPNRSVTIIDLNLGATTVIPLWTQVEMYKREMLLHFEANPGGIHVIGYSQGSIISRAVIENCPNHSVHTYISLAGVQMGVSEISAVASEYFGLAKSSANYNFAEFHTTCYKAVEQKANSLCNLWRDEKHLPAYLEENIFLPKINNEITHENLTEYKENILKLKKFVMIAGPEDQVIAPWQSGLFGSKNANNEIVKMEDQMIYETDVLGLKTLNERGAVIQHEVSGVDHTTFSKNEEICEKYINPYFD